MEEDIKKIAEALAQHPEGLEVARAFARFQTRENAARSFDLHVEILALDAMPDFGGLPGFEVRCTELPGVCGYGPHVRTALNGFRTLLDQVLDVGQQMAEGGTAAH